MLSQDICIRNSTCKCNNTVVYSEFPFKIICRCICSLRKVIVSSCINSQIFTIYALNSSIFTVNSDCKFIFFRSNDFIICLGEIISEVATVAYQHRIYEIFTAHEYILAGGQLCCDLLICMFSRCKSIGSSLYSAFNIAFADCYGIQRAGLGYCYSGCCTCYCCGSSLVLTEPIFQAQRLVITCDSYSAVGIHFATVRRESGSRRLVGIRGRQVKCKRIHINRSISTLNCQSLNITISVCTTYKWNVVCCSRCNIR